GRGSAGCASRTRDALLKRKECRAMKQSADKRPIGASSGRAAPGSSRMRAHKAPSRGKRRARARPERSAVLPRQPLPLDVAEIAREIGIPLQLWVGNCGELPPAEAGGFRDKLGRNRLA